MAIVANQIAASAIETEKLAGLAITTAKIAADAIDGTKLADNAVDSEHMATGSIDSGHFSAGAVDATALGSDAVTTAKVLNANITLAKMADNSVDENKIAASCLGSSLTGGGGTALDVATSGVTNDMLAGSIAESKLADTFVRADGSNTFSADQSMGGMKLTGLGAPTADTDAATKGYVDNLVEGLNPKDSVCALESSNVTKSGLPTADDIALTAGQRILLTGQTTGSENGAWEVAAGAWTRPDDFPNAGSASAAFFFVEEGTNYGDSGWLCTSDQLSDTIDSDNLAFTQFSGAGQITAGLGLTKSGNTIDIDLGLENPCLEFDSDRLQLQLNDSGALGRSATGVGVNTDGSTLEVSGNALQIVDGGVDTTQLAADCVTGAEIADDAIDSEHYTDGSIDTAHLASQAVTEAKIHTSVAGDGLAGGNGTALSVTVDSIGIEILADSLQLKDAGVTNAKLAGSITGNKADSTFMHQEEFDPGNDDFVDLSYQAYANSVSLFRNGLRMKKVAAAPTGPGEWQWSDDGGAPSRPPMPGTL